MQLNSFLGRAGGAEATLHPSLQIFFVSHLVMIILHHVHVACLNENLLAITHRLKQLLVVLLFLYDLLLGAEFLSLLTDFLLENIVLTKLAQLLLEHQLVILGLDEFFDLLLTALEFEHNLTVAIFNGLAVIALTMATKLKCFLAILLGLLPFATLLLVVALHASGELALFGLGLLNSVVHDALLVSSIHDEVLA